MRREENCRKAAKYFGEILKTERNDGVFVPNTYDLVNVTRYAGDHRRPNIKL